MGRIRQNVEISGTDRWTLFDSGSRNSYITSEAAKSVVQLELSSTRQTALGGKHHTITHSCNLQCRVNSHDLDFHAYVLPDIGKDDEGKSIELLFGALAMQQWGIGLNLQQEQLDMTHFPEEFIEY